MVKVGMTMFIRKPYANELMHFGIKGQKWGVRRYQNPDGSLTEEGKKRYGNTEYNPSKNYFKNNPMYEESGRYNRYVREHDITDNFMQFGEKFLGKKMTGLDSFEYIIKNYYNPYNLEQKKPKASEELKKLISEEKKAWRVQDNNLAYVGEHRAIKDMANIAAFANEKRFKVYEQLAKDFGITDYADKAVLYVWLFAN